MVNVSAVAIALLLSTPAAAASLQLLPQSQWWAGERALPSYVNMYLYVPDQRLEHPPIVVAPHHCQGTGPGTFREMSGLVALADQSGFVMIFPEATGQNCWDAGSARSLTHDGNGDTHAIVQMVRYTLAAYAGNPARVYSVGGSSGAIITEALLAVYPDVFMAGVSYMGVPAGCWANGYNDVVGKPANGTGQWSGPCAGGNLNQSAETWGNLARSFFPGYGGHRPRLQHWHGTADTTISPKNLNEDIKQWTNVLGLSETPTGTDNPSSGTTHQYWTNSCGYVVYETFSLAGVAHAVPFDGNAVATYFGLGASDGPDPEAVACPPSIPESVSDQAAPMDDGGAPSGGDSGSSRPTSAAGSDGTFGPLTPPTRGDAVSANQGESSSSAAEVDEDGTPQNMTGPGNVYEPAASSMAGSALSAGTTSGSCSIGWARAAEASTPLLSGIAGIALFVMRRRRNHSTN